MSGTSDYQNELAKIDGSILELREIGKPDTEQTTKLVYRLYQRASLTGRLDQFTCAQRALRQAVERIPHWPDLWLIQANLHFKFHRLRETKEALAMVPGLAESVPARVLAADIALQEGEYETARLAYESLIEEERTWDNLARLAYWKSKFGGEDETERLYQEAEDEITAKEMRGYAWVQLQRGLLDLRGGRFAEAAEHYRRAAQAYSGYWLVQDHTAELLGAQGDWHEAIALYERVLANTPRPELQQAFGELYAAMEEPALANRWFDTALAGYLESAQAGGVHYYHHLVDFYSDVRESGADAVEWARKDIELRRNFGTEAALAWALFRDGQVPEAMEWMDWALASGVRDAHLFAKAAKVSAAAGRIAESGDLQRRSLEMNPYNQGFHVHRS